MMLFFDFKTEKENAFLRAEKSACKATLRMIEGLRPS